MTRAEFILELLREKPRTFDELVQLAGVSTTIIRTTLSDLARNGYMEAIPKTYHATKKDKGGKPMINWQLKEERKGERRGPKPKTDGIVASALKSQPTSVFHLGSLQ